jgi:hypothetical protein
MLKRRDIFRKLLSKGGISCESIEASWAPNRQFYRFLKRMGAWRIQRRGEEKKGKRERIVWTGGFVRLSIPTIVNPSTERRP